MRHYEEIAKPLVKLGYDPTPINGKRAYVREWQKYPAESLEFSKHENANVGIICGGTHNIVAVDVDVRDEGVCNEIRALVFDLLGKAPERTGAAPKTLFVFRTTEVPKHAETNVFKIHGKNTQVETRAQNQYFVGYGIHPDTKKPFQWPNDDLADYAPEELTQITPQQLDEFLHQCECILAAYGTIVAKSVVGNQDKKKRATSKLSLKEDLGKEAPASEITAALANVPSDISYNDWCYVAHAIKGALGEEGFSVFDEWSQTASNQYQANESTRVWQSIKNVQHIGAGTIFKLANEASDGDWSISKYRDEQKLTLAAECEDSIFDPASPLTTARSILDSRYTANDSRTLYHHAGVFRSWDRNCYREADVASIKAAVYRISGEAQRQKANGDFEPFNPTTNKVNNILDALKSDSNLSSDVRAPAWLDGRKLPDPNHLIAMENGLLDIKRRELHRPSPLFWTHNALGYSYSGGQTICPNWLGFLDDVWPDDSSSRAALQEMFGYLLTADTRQQKAFLLIGPKRSGKGNIGRVLTELLGRDNICSPTLASLSSQFGLAPLIDKLVAIVADARLGSRADQQQIAERLLSISGEDGQTIDRKFIQPWQGTLTTRFLIMTNELPRIADASGALSGRFIVLKMTNSFFGNEDLGLTAKLLAELPAILNWALDGRDRLIERGHFVQPDSAKEAIQDLEDLSSPITAFVRDRCAIGVEYSVSVDDAFNSWVLWCSGQGRDHSGTKPTFSRDLKAAVPGVVTKQKRGGGKKPRHFFGIKLV
jgi:putative DNA primase/helicase